MSEFDKPRLSIEISEELYERKKRLIPWGQEAILIRKLLSDALDLIEFAEDKGPIVIGAIMSGDVSIMDLVIKRRK